MKMSLFESYLGWLLGSPDIRGSYSGDNLIKRCEEVHLGQRELERRVGVEHPTATYWKQGRNSPTLEHVVKLQMVLYEELRKVHKREIDELKEALLRARRRERELRQEIREMQAAEKGK